jgi:hypothetical protein
LAVHKEQVVGPTVWRLEDELANGYPLSSSEIDRVGILNGPSGGF